MPSCGYQMYYHLLDAEIDLTQVKNTLYYQKESQKTS